MAVDESSNAPATLDRRIIVIVDLPSSTAANRGDAGAASTYEELVGGESVFGAFSVVRATSPAVLLSEAAISAERIEVLSRRPDVKSILFDRKYDEERNDDSEGASDGPREVESGPTPTDDVREVLRPQIALLKLPVALDEATRLHLAEYMRDAEHVPSPSRPKELAPRSVVPIAIVLVLVALVVFLLARLLSG